MNLKQFHVVFIVVSAALCLWLLGWGVAHRGETLGAALSGVGTAGFVALAAYLRYFLRAVRPQNGLHPKLALLAATAWPLLEGDARACVVCMGQPDGNTARAFTLGIAFLAVVVLLTLSGITYMMITAIRERERREQAVPISR